MSGLSIHHALLILLFSPLAKIAFAQDILREETLGDPIDFGERQLRVVYEWNTIDFAYADDNDRGRARKSGEYIEANVIISDVKAFANRLYVTLPRMLPGVPATLGWIIAPDNNGRTDPLVEPFPSWEMNAPGDCRALQFVQAIEIDEDGLLWATDSGRPPTLSQEATTRVCPPKLIIFDLKRNGTIVHQYEFSEEVVRYGTNFLNKIVVDDAVTGFAYITDNSGEDPGIVVYSRKLERSWKIREPNSMRAAADAVDFAVNGTRLRFSIHIDGIAMGPYYTTDGGLKVDRNVYYSPLSSYHLYSIPTSVLRTPELSQDPAAVLEFVTDYGVKLSQSDGMIMDNRGILYYGLLREHAIAIWDSNQPFTLENQRILAKDPNFIQWTDGMSFDENGNLYVVINRLYNFVAGRLNPNQVNFRILRAQTDGLSYTFTNKQVTPLGPLPPPPPPPPALRQNLLDAPPPLFFNAASNVQLLVHLQIVCVMNVFFVYFFFLD